MNETIGSISVENLKGGGTTPTQDSQSNSADEPSRGNWSNPLEFILACVGYAVGLGNVWRFPYLVFRNGGGAFLVPYLLMVLIIGLPIFFAELYVGQYSGLGPIKAYSRLAPFFHGLGYCTLVIITFVTIYYMVVIAWIIFYLFASFSHDLKWGSCSNEFNTDFCYTALEDQQCRINNENGLKDQIFWNRTCTNVVVICQNYKLEAINASFCKNTAITPHEEVSIRQLVKPILASEEYFNKYVLGVSDQYKNATWDDWGYPRWQLVLCLLLAWLIAFFCLIKGVKSAGKVVYFTALFPYVVLTALLVRGATLPGADVGVSFYVTPVWDTLLNPSVWGDAASQIFYSFGLACGSLVTFSSYNRFTNNCHTDAIIVSFTNVFTAVFAGFAVFSVLGFMANNIDVPVSEVIESGPGLAFIAYPEAVLLMPLPQLWSVLFFFMMLILGMGSQFGGIEAMCTSVVDQWPHLRNHRWRVTAGVCLFCFLAELPMVCDGGVYMFTLMEWHTASWAILLLGLAEVVVISWIYGMDRVFKDLAKMGMRMSYALQIYWWSVWMFITPIASVGVFVFTMLAIEPTEYSSYVFPKWADALGWLMGTATLAPFPVFIIYRFIKSNKKPWFQTTLKWKPQNECHEELHVGQRKLSGINNEAFEGIQ